MTLPYREVRSEDGDDSSSPLVFLHGFLGAGRNWASFARRLVDLRPDWHAVLVDLPFHGAAREPGVAPTVAAAAHEVADVLRRVEADVAAGPGSGALLGHSFGGKVALRATSESTPPPVQTWIVDSTPSARDTESAAGTMLQRLLASPATFADRAAAVGYVREAGFDEPTARWMATNLERHGDAWRWALDAAPLSNLLADFRSTDLWAAVETSPPGSDLHFVRATRGSIVSDADADRLRDAAARGQPVTLHRVDGGHWLHVDNPDGLLELIADRLPRL